MTTTAIEVSSHSNTTIARQLDCLADLLEAQHANEYRIRAYRAAAETVRTQPQPVHDLLAAEGIAGLTRLPTIGDSLARTIAQLDHSGTTPLLAQLQGETSPEQILTTVAGIGPTLASRIHEQLGIATLADLYLAAHDGRLDRVAGFGPQRLRGIRETLAGRFRHGPYGPSGAGQAPLASQPDVAVLLDIDSEYRRKTAAGMLPLIAPQRFNPAGSAWLPVLHTTREGAHYTALFSNTARAHELGMIRDWVVIYRDDHDGAGQWTVITALEGPLRGKRIVRGREAECSRYYGRAKAARAN
jgi:predicted flap endonuclease-1-like 5' DNA nuclease